MNIKNIVSLKVLLPFMFLLLSLGNLVAQDIEYGVEVDTNMIVIGDQIHLKLKVKKPDNVTVVFPQLNDTIVSGIEILEKKPIDSTKLENNWRMLVQEYVVTSFDTGLYHIPALPFVVKSQNFDNVVRSNDFYIGVTSFAVDTTKGFFDIVLPIDTPLSLAEILPYVYWTVLGILVALLLLWLYKKYRRKESVFVKHEKKKEPPHIIAFSSLDLIKGENLWQRGKVKEYYTRVTEVIRVYLEDQFGIYALEQTTDEIMEDVKADPLISKDVCDKLKDMLTRADFVKFAKAEPLPDENHKTLTDAYEVVTQTRKILADKQQKEEEARIAAEAGKRAAEEAEKNKNNFIPGQPSVEIKKEAEESAAQSHETNNN